MASDLGPFALIPVHIEQKNKAVKPSPSGLWWFLDQLTPRDRRWVNEAQNGQAMVHAIQILYARNPELAAEALEH